MSDLQDKAKRHLWLHFSRMGHYADHEVPVIVRGEGCWVEDQHGRRYLDMLSGLFVVQVGHGRTELAEAAARQGSELGYFPMWSYAHEPGIELAAAVAERAPGDLQRVFFTTGGSDAVESAWKLARQYFKVIGEPNRYKVISRQTAYHGTTMGALSITGVPAIRNPFEPLVPGAVKARNTNAFRDPLAGDPEAFTAACVEAIERAIVMEGPETVAAVFLEPLQNAGGCFTPPPGYFAKVRAVCDRYGVLLVSDEVICGWGRLGHWYGCERYGYQPDIVTWAKGITSGYSPLGGMTVSDRLMSPFLEAKRSFAHGITFGGHPVSCAVALANIGIIEREGLLDNVRANEAGLRAMLERVKADCPLVGDVRGDGYFWALELVRDQATGARFDQADVEPMLRGFLAPRLFELGLICRSDDRGDPVLQFSPPLIAGPEEIEATERILRQGLTETWAHLRAQGIVG